ncbi:excalibur calcium-binding domain-containing protein [Longispora sp. K20-0274]|uniref:excalibur calcium-binding domain-containing protein n=1 Tax=Longispora sp. K20-0274 TaxID=3088255 RepID=UPI00399B9F77
MTVAPDGYTSKPHAAATARTNWKSPWVLAPIGAAAFVLLLCCGLVGAVAVSGPSAQQTAAKNARARQTEATVAPSPSSIPVVPSPSPSPTPSPTPMATTPAPAVSYANCDAVRAAGKAPLYRGQPGYAAHLDADGDGIACEGSGGSGTGGGGTGGTGTGGGGTGTGGGGTGGGGGTAVYYANCDAVRAAGKAPLYRGQPGYRDALDRDKDGIACE